MKQSTTKTIKRSEITLNPYNPKRHTDEQVSIQKKNIKKNGYLGGVVWNEVTGNLIDGHRRIQAMDSINKYDGSPATDYDIKVEAVEFDEKTEKEQMTYMAVGNSKADYNLIAEYIGDIDYESAGLSQEDFDTISELLGHGDDIPDMQSFGDPFAKEAVTELQGKEDSFEDIAGQRAEKPSMTKEQVKAEKQHCQDVASNHHEESTSYAMIRFANDDEKEVFCDIMGVEFSRNVVVKGIDILNSIQ